MDNVINEMIGKTIIGGYVDGFHIMLVFDDGAIFEYDASDGGYSSWEFVKGE